MTDMHTAAHDAALGSAVNAPTDVELYDPTGKVARVPSADADYWLAHGFSRTPVDPVATAKDLAALMDAAHTAVNAYVDAVTKDGIIDTNDAAAQATAATAMRLVEEAWGRLQRDVARLYGVNQGEPTVMKDADGAEHQVDPGQVALYREQGWKEVKAK